MEFLCMLTAFVYENYLIHSSICATKCNYSKALLSAPWQLGANMPDRPQRDIYFAAIFS